MGIRQQKLGAQIRRLLAELLLRGEIADARLSGLITITRVEVTPDLLQAAVYVSILAPKTTPKTVIEGLRSATRHIQSDLADGLTTRVVPHLEFHLDDSLKKEARLLQQINEVAQEFRTPEPESPAEPEQA